MRRHKTPFAIAAAFCVAVAAYAVYWWIAAGGIRTGIDDWAAERRAAGWTVSYGEVSVGGFPTRLRAQAMAPDIAAPAAPVPWRWRAPVVTATARPWNLRNVALAAPEPHRIDLAGGPRRRPLIVEAATLSAALIIGDDGRLRTMTADLGRLTVAAAGRGPASSIAAQSATVALTGPDAATAAITLLEVDLPAGAATPFGRHIERVTLEAAIKGPLGPGSLHAALRAWRDAGGTLEVGNLTVEWPPLSLAAQGTVALDPDMQPIGAMTAYIRGYREAIEILVRSGAVRPGDAATARLVLGLLARSPAGGGPPRVKAPLTVQGRRLYVGPVRLMRLPRVVWE